jgi:hypothetical protein
MSEMPPIDLEAAIAQINARIDGMIEGAAHHRRETQLHHPNSAANRDEMMWWALDLGRALGLADALFYLGDTDAERRITTAAKEAGAM